MKLRSDDVEPAGEGGELLADGLEDVAVVVDQVHLVDAQQQVGHPEQRGQEGVPTGLLDDPLAGVDQHDGQVGRRVPGDHVAGVLDVAGGVGDDELAGRGGEVAVGHVDGDALLPLGPQAVGQQGQVGVLVAPLAADPLDRLELVLEDGLGVVQQAPDERALAVVDRARRGQAQELHQKYPSRLRSSMAASLTRSSARVAPRSVSREAATSATMSSADAAGDSTAPVTGHVPHRAVADDGLEDLLVVPRGDVGARRRAACRPGGTPGGGGSSRSAGSSMPSAAMYCQMSSSVQSDSGKTRMCSPARCRPL